MKTMNVRLGGASVFMRNQYRSIVTESIGTRLGILPLQIHFIKFYSLNTTHGNDS